MKKMEKSSYYAFLEKLAHGVSVRRFFHQPLAEMLV